MNAIILSIIASLGYGLCGPFAKIALKNGMHSNGFVFTYGLALIFISLPTISTGGFQLLFPNSSALWFGIISGVLCAIGLKGQADAFAIPTSLIAVVSIIAATYPLVSSAVSIPFMGEAEKILLPKFFIGAILIIAGGYLVTTSVK